MELDRRPCEPLKLVPFLDTSCSIENGRIEIDLYRKESNRNPFILPDSCHSKMVTRNIPFSLSLRIVRICTNSATRDTRLQELKTLLTERKYSPSLVDSAISRAKAIPRKKAILQVKKKDASKRPIFALKYDPRLPAIPSLMAKHWRSMKTQSKYLGQVFPQPPLTAYRRQNNIQNMIIKSKVAEPQKLHPKRNIKGMFKCGKACTACPFIKEGKNIKIDNTSKWHLNKTFSCKNYNIIYLIFCEKERCRENIYIGETGKSLERRLANHRGYVVNNMTDRATGAHFNLPGHSLADLKITILEQVKKKRY